MSQEDLRERSGNVNIKSRLVSFLYDLMRDHLTPGQVEELVGESTDTEVAYTNGYLAQYAWDLAQRLQPSRIKSGGLLKEVLRTRFRMVKEGHSTLNEEVDRVYAALTENDPLLTTGNGRNHSTPVSGAPNTSMERPYLGKALVQSLLMAFQQGHLTNEDAANRILQEVNKLPKVSSTSEVEAAPSGRYGVFCEPLGHKGNPCWAGTETPMCYEKAAKEADLLNRSNHAWHYYAKPIR